MRTVKLGDVATIERVGLDPSTLDPTTPYLGLEHIERGGQIIGRSSVGGSELASTKFSFTPEHVLFGKLRPYLAKIARPDFAGVCSTDILPLRPGERVDRDYLVHYLRLPRTVDQASTRATGANLPRLSPGVLATFEIPLPPLPEQRRIAAILDHADALRAKRRHSLTLLDTLTQTAFADMFGNPDTASRTVAFGEVASLVGGRNLVAGDSNAVAPYRVLKISAVTTGLFRPQESKPLPLDYVPPSSHLVSVGDLLMSRANTAALVGAVAYVESTPENLALPDKIWRFVWREAGSDPVFYQALFQTPSVRRRISTMASGTGGSMKNVSKAKVETLALPVVPLELQREFASRVGEINAQRAAAQRSLDSLDELFASLQSRAFSGQL